ncbi:MAG: hypothetical protein LBS83_02160 [Holosporales bacterium]|jgi:hypothetical protein|nr:hypothetical protein [Holosporales bacterium]
MKMSQKVLFSIYYFVGVLFLNNDFALAKISISDGSHLKLDKKDGKYKLGDFGFRWKKSLNFTVNGKAITSWKITNFPRENINSANGLHRYLRFHADQSFIHIRRKDNEQRNGKDVVARYNAAVAAITVVYEDNGEMKACTKILAKQGQNTSNPLVCFPAGWMQELEKRTQYDLYFDDKTLEKEAQKLQKCTKNTFLERKAAAFFRFLSKASLAKFFIEQGTELDLTSLLKNDTCSKESRGVGGFVPEVTFQCSETGIMSQLFGEYVKDKKIILPEILSEILRTENIKTNQVKCIVLHVHSTMFPCASCTTLVGVISYVMNNLQKYSYVEKFLVSNGRSSIMKGIVNNLKNGKCKFFIELSSSTHFPYNYEYDANDPKYGDYGFRRLVNVKKQCCHTECVGHDANANKRVNIETRDTKAGECRTAIQTFIPNFAANQSKNFKFKPTFPPYYICAGIDEYGNMFIPSPNGEVCKGSLSKHIYHENMLMKDVG